MHNGHVRAQPILHKSDKEKGDPLLHESPSFSTDSK